jgi:ABC-type multidrug transport system fused ATPase/permease subunit
MVNILQSTAAAAERIFEFLAEEEEVQETSQPAVIENLSAASNSAMYLSAITRTRPSSKIQRQH